MNGLAELPGRLPGDRLWPAGVVGLRAERHVLASGAAVHVVVGEPPGGATAPTVLLLHGWACSAYSFRELLPALVAAGHRVVAPDLVGHGRSDKPLDPGRYSAASLVAHARELRDRFGGERPLLVGHSLGGALVLRLALDEPARCRALVLLSPANLGSVPITGLARLLTPAALQPLLPRVGWRWTFALVLALVSGQRAAYTREEVDQYWAPTADPRFLAALRQVLHEYDWRPLEPTRLATLRPPTLLVHGTADRVVRPFGPSWPGWAALASAGVERHVITGGGHVPHEERPAEVLALVARFLGSHGR